MNDILKKKGAWAGKLAAKGYVMKSWLLALFVLIIPGLIIGAVWLKEGTGTKWSVECRFDTTCKNKFYSCNPLLENCPPQKLKDRVCTDNPALCNMPYLPAHSYYGDKPGIVQKYFSVIYFGIVGLGYGLNHVLFNRKSQRQERIKHNKPVIEEKKGGDEWQL